MTSNRTPTLLMLPGLLWLVALMVVPCLLIFVLIFFERGTYGGIDWAAPTLENISRAFDPLYATILWDSFRIAGLATIFGLVIGYPAAYAISKAPERWQTSLLFLAILPFWTNYLIRTYAWIIVLGNRGFVNGSLMALGLIDAPIPLLFTRLGVVVALVHVTLPVVVIMLAAAIAHIDRDLERAAAALGARPLRVFWTVTLPLSMPGIIAGLTTGFAWTFSAFATPQLIGGGRVNMVSNLVYSLGFASFNFPFAAALSVAGLVLTAVALAGFRLLLRPLHKVGLT